MRVLDNILVGFKRRGVGAGLGVIWGLGCITGLIWGGPLIGGGAVWAGPVNTATLDSADPADSGNSADPTRSATNSQDALPAETGVGTQTASGAASGATTASTDDPSNISAPTLPPHTPHLLPHISPAVSPHAAGPHEDAYGSPNSHVTDTTEVPEYVQSPVLEAEFGPETPKDSSQQIVRDDTPIPARMLVSDLNASEREMFSELIEERLDKAGVESTSLSQILLLSLLGLVPLALLVLLYWWKQRSLQISRPRWIDDEV